MGWLNQRYRMQYDSIFQNECHLAVDEMLRIIYTYLGIKQHCSYSTTATTQTVTPPCTVVRHALLLHVEELNGGRHQNKTDTIRSTPDLYTNFLHSSCLIAPYRKYQGWINKLDASEQEVVENATLFPAKQRRASDQLRIVHVRLSTFYSS